MASWSQTKHRSDMPSQHAFLSPSASHRWLNCTPAPHLEYGVEDKGSDFALEGTLAHAYCARRLKEMLELPHEEEDAEIAELHDRFYAKEMDEYVDYYVTTVWQKYLEASDKTRDAKLLVEVRLDFSKYIPESFGTSDAVIIADGMMEVIDFKYGKGVKVDAKDNPQMQIYALGAYEAFSDEYRIESVRMTIVQPRIDNVSVADISIKNLVAWGIRILRPRAYMAYRGKGEQVPGEWCQFCKVKPRCKAIATKSMEIVRRFDDKDLLTKEDMENEILPALPVVRTWLDGIEKYALDQALSGVDYEGYKVVAGRSIRRITDAEAVSDVLSRNGYSTELFLKPRELRTITDLEKLIGRSKFSELCGEYIDKPQGKPTLVPVTDKRPPFNPADDFAGI